MRIAANRTGKQAEPRAKGVTRRARSGHEVHKEEDCARFAGARSLRVALCFLVLFVLPLVGAYQPSRPSMFRLAKERATSRATKSRA